MTEKGTNNQNTNCDADTVIVCDEALDIRCVSDMKILFDEAIAAKKPVTLKAEKVERADTAGLQLCCAFFKDAIADGINITWSNPSDALKKSAGLIGVSESLGL